ncbi:MAG: 50S ribosomal protein L25 [candidate division Zixibacteria bacterium]|nr:50S ribosomal protein L25 [candidate division Zixibacteria bacterium]
MEEILIPAQERDSSGKGVARKLRAAGRIPAIFYARAQEPMAIDIEAKNFEFLMRNLGGKSLVIKLDIKGSKRMALIRDIQRDPISNEVLHADFYGIAMDQKIGFSVPINFEGIAVGVSGEGGIQQSIMRELEVSCLPANIPEEIVINVAEMSIGDSIHVRDIEQEGVEIISDPKRTIVTIIPPTVIKAAATEEEEEEEGEAAEESEDGEVKEPEVITEKKKEGE